MKSTVLPIAFSAALLAGPAIAQGAAQSPVEKGASEVAEAQKIQDFELDLTIPEAPGFAVIGLTPTKVVDPATGRMTILDFIPYTDDEGNLKPGFAATVSPYFLLQQGKTLASYRDKTQTSWAERAIARLQFSAGFAEGGDGKPDKIGLGFSTDLLDNGDYRLNEELYYCASDAYRTIFADSVEEAVRGAEKSYLETKNVGSIDALAPADKVFILGELVRVRLEARKRQQAEVMATHGEAYKEKRQACRDKFKKDYLNQAAFVVAGGFAWNTKGGGVGNEKFDGGSLWASYRQPLGLRKMVSTKSPQSGALADPDEGGSVLPNYVTAFARYDFDKKAEIPGGTQEFDQLTGALVGGYVWKSGAKLSFEGGYERLNYRGVGPLKDNTSSFYAVTVKYPVGRGAWLEMKGGASKSNPAAPGDRDDKVTLTFHWAPPQS